MTRGQLGGLSCGVSVALILLAVAATYLALDEAYGSGPPYFGRTQNMDKWSDPVPALAIIDSVCVVVAGILWRMGRRFLRTRDAPQGTPD